MAKVKIQYTVNGAIKIRWFRTHNSFFLWQEKMIPELGLFNIQITFWAY